MRAAYQFVPILFIVVVLSACVGNPQTDFPDVHVIPSETPMPQTLATLLPFQTYTPTNTVPQLSATPPPFPTFTATNTFLPPEPAKFPYAPILNEMLPKENLLLAAHVYADMVGHISTDDVCYDVGIYKDNSYIVVSCLADFIYPAPQGVMDANESGHFQRWVERFASYEEPSQHLFFKFVGNGTNLPDYAEKLAMENLVSALEYRAHAYASGGGLPPSVGTAQRVLGQKIGVSPESIRVLKFESVEFSDTCLGGPKPDEVCEQVVTPGLRVLLIAQGMLYEFHTDFRGYDIRSIGEPQIAPTQSPAG